MAGKIEEVSATRRNVVAKDRKKFCYNVMMNNNTMIEKLKNTLIGLFSDTFKPKQMNGRQYFVQNKTAEKHGAVDLFFLDPPTRMTQ